MHLVQFQLLRVCHMAIVIVTHLVDVLVLTRAWWTPREGNVTLFATKRILRVVVELFKVGFFVVACWWVSSNRSLQEVALAGVFVNLAAGNLVVMLLDAIFIISRPRLSPRAICAFNELIVDARHAVGQFLPGTVNRWLVMAWSGGSSHFVWCGSYSL